MLVILCIITDNIVKNSYFKAISKSNINIGGFQIII